MIVLRVEHDSIKNYYVNFPVGPFQDDSILIAFMDDEEKMGAYTRAVQKLMEHLSTDRAKFPTPMADPSLGWIAPNEVCGVDSLESLHEWFADALPLLEECGFVIAKYEVPNKYCKLGRTGQVVFDSKHAKKIEEITDDRQDA